MVKKIRYWLIRFLLTDDEKYLLIRAIDDRIDKVERIRIESVYNLIDFDNYYNDMVEYRIFRNIFSTELWR